MVSMVKTLSAVLFVLAFVRPSFGLNNGLALTPPMGWLSWERFRCTTNCYLFPDDCISEKLMREQADRMVDDGYLAAGYQYLIIDDCWMAKDRDANGSLQEDPQRFPSGMKALSDYIHSKGLKFGIYEDYGMKTCEGYPGIKGHLAEDAQLFADWNADYVKIDGCNSEPIEIAKGYIAFGQELLNTRKPIVYSCSWPFYEEKAGMSPNFTLISQHCNLWRNYNDVEDSWSSVSSIIEYFGTRQELLAQHSGPGQWNDPDMLIIGNYGLSYEQSKAQMAIWSILSAPLIMSHDMRKVRPEYREILLNREAIAINQDPSGKPGKRKFKVDKVEIWTKRLSQTLNGLPVWAVAVLNKRSDGALRYISVPIENFGLEPSSTYIFYEVFEAIPQFTLQPNENLKVRVPPSGVLFFKVTTEKEGNLSALRSAIEKLAEGPKYDDIKDGRSEDVIDDVFNIRKKYEDPSVEVV